MAVSVIAQDLGLLNNAYGPASQGEWSLARGVYFNDKAPNGIVFFYETRKDEPTGNRTGMDQVSDQGGRRLAIYEYPYRDGQAVKDLGRKGETFTFNIKFFGNNYQNRFNDFVEKVCKSNAQGKIVHPVRGQFSVRFKEWDFNHRHDEWNSVTIKATFLEDTSIEIAASSIPKVSADSALRKAIQDLAVYENTISSNVAQLASAINLPNSVRSGLGSTLASITARASQLIGQLTATFSTDSTQQQLSSQIAATNSGSVGAINSGTVTTGGNIQATLPPVFQTGMDQTSADFVNNQTSTFVNANKITPQQAVYSTNVIRSQTSTAIQDINDNFGNSGYNTVLNYRAMMNSIQETVELCLSSSQNKVQIYTTQRMMSVRQVLFAMGLDADRQNEVAQLNPYLASINFIPPNTNVTVPAA